MAIEGTLDQQESLNHMLYLVRKKGVGNLNVVTGVSESPKYVDLALKLDIDETKRSLQVPRCAQKYQNYPNAPKVLNGPKISLK